MKSSLVKNVLNLAVGTSLLTGAGASAQVAAAPATTVVLVHGAFADGSSWSKVIPLLQAKGLRVVAVQNPLTSLADDVRATQNAIDLAPGPIVLVGHSWGGSVITQAGTDAKVKSLVYVAAFAPSVGKSTLDEVGLFPVAPGFKDFAPNSHGFFILSPESLAANFAQDLPVATSAVMNSTQGPTAAAAFGDKLTNAGWEKHPSYYIVSADDRMINPDYERAVALKLGAKVTTLKASHSVMLSQPARVADVILEAVRN